MLDSPLRLLCLLAHPDDETLGTGGVLARYAAEGVETHVLTATRGDAGRYGRPDTPHPGREALGRIREEELREAARVLGVTSVEVLGYPDGGLDGVDAAEAVGRIAHRIRGVRPHVVVTFDPFGAYGHPDHIAVSQLATAATVAAAGPARPVAPGSVGTSGDGGPAPAPSADPLPDAARRGAPPESADTASPSPWTVSKLYYMAWNRDQWAAYQAAFKTLTSTVDGVERQASPWPGWSITTEVDATEHWRTVWDAVRCHASQMAVYGRLAELDEDDHRALWGRQTFYRAYSLTNGGRRREHDLFEGLR